MTGRDPLVPRWSSTGTHATAQVVARKAQRSPTNGGKTPQVTGLGPNGDLSVTRQPHTFTWTALANRSILPPRRPAAARRSLHVHYAFGQSGDYGHCRG